MEGKIVPATGREVVLRVITTEFAKLFGALLE